MTKRGYKQTPDWIRKRVESRKGYHPSAESKKKMSEAKIGAKNPAYGSHWTPKQRMAIIASHLGKKQSIESRKKISAARITCDKGAMNKGYQIRRRIDHQVTEKLESMGYIVLRFWEHEINGNLNECVNKVTAKAGFQGS